MEASWKFSFFVATTKSALQHCLPESRQTMTYLLFGLERLFTVSDKVRNAALPAPAPLKQFRGGSKRLCYRNPAGQNILPFRDHKTAADGKIEPGKG